MGGGLFSGTVLFRILHLYSKKEDLEILTTLLVILTIIQPFICLHPVIIWSQDSDHNAVYLILTIFVWFLPHMVHLLVKFILTNINRRYGSRATAVAVNNMAELTPLNTSDSRSRQEKKQQRSAYASKTSLLSSRKGEASATASTTSSPMVKPASAAASPISRRLVGLIDVGMQVVQLVIFLVAFSFVTHYIVHTELDSSKANLKKFVLPAIVSVFVWMTSIAYFLLDLTMNATKESAPLVFKDDEAAVAARNELRQSLRRRLELMDKRTTIGALPPRPRPLRPSRPPPPPPVRPKPSAEAGGSYQKPALGGRPPIPPKPERLTAIQSRHLSRPPPPPVAPKPKAATPEDVKNEVKANLFGQRSDYLRSRSLPPGSRAKYFHGQPRSRVVDNIDLASSSDSLVIQIREAACDADSLVGACHDDEDLSSAVVGTASTEASSRLTPLEIEEAAGADDRQAASCCARALNYLLERQEYAFPELHGWRIRFRRIFLHLGVLGFSYTTYQTIQARIQTKIFFFFNFTQVLLRQIIVKMFSLLIHNIYSFPTALFNKVFLQKVEKICENEQFYK